MTWQMYGNEKFDEGREEGHKSGLAEGRKIIASQMKKEGLSIELIAKILQSSESDVEQLLL